MKIILNGEDRTSAYQGETLGDIFDQVHKKCEADGEIISHLLIDDKEAALDSMAARKTSTADVKSLEIETATLAEILERNILNAQNYLQKLLPGIEKTAEIFRSGNEQEANQLFLQIIDGMDWFSQVMEIVIQVKQFEPDRPIYNGKSLKDQKNQFADLTRQMLEANKNKDWVLLADLLEYELLPYYQEWNDFLPKIRSL